MKLKLIDRSGRLSMKHMLERRKIIIKLYLGLHSKYWKVLSFKREIQTLGEVNLIIWIFIISLNKTKKTKNDTSSKNNLDEKATRRELEKLTLTDWYNAENQVKNAAGGKPDQERNL